MNNKAEAFDQLSKMFLWKEPWMTDRLALKLKCIKVKTRKILLSTPVIRQIIAVYNILIQEDQNIAFATYRDSIAQNNAVSHIHDMVQNKELEKLVKAYIDQNNLSTQYCLESYNKLLEELKDFNLSRLCSNTSNLIDQVKTHLEQNKRFIEDENTSMLQNLIINYQQLLQARKCINIFFITLKYARRKEEIASHIS